jgi:hypothetical protein
LFEANEAEPLLRDINKASLKILILKFKLVCTSDIQFKAKSKFKLNILKDYFILPGGNFALSF